ncbi:nuclear transport factor 2 family protein [Uliginosibacterium gangwonense]|uniref:nuclear transport factor 2 family protein n=1 Tax=Uliginosibacterium gangwonense TaxID=392736 RepID=UPI000364F50E|nr:nuclear transport factor 2 family protein [Uliginosibacterium gangwonense]
MLRPPYSSLRLLIGVAIATSCALLPHAAMAGMAEAQTYLQQGQHAQALEQVDKVLAANSKDRQARFLKGVILAEMNKLDDAAAVFIKLSEEAPELPEPYNNLAVIYAQQKQYEKARAALEMAIRTHPSYAVAHENLGDLYAKMARQAYDRALQIDAGNSTAQTKLNLIRDIISVSSRPGTTTARTPEKTVLAQNTAASVAKPGVQVIPVAPPPAVTKPVATPQPPVVAATPQKPAKPEPAKLEAPAKSEPVKAEPAKPAKSEPVVEAKDESKAVHAAVNAWASAWSNKEVRAYLNVYAKDFSVPDGKSRSAWEKERTERIDKPGKIKVALADVDIRIKGDQATVRFKQNYTSASFTSSSGKTLIMVQRNGRWQIQQERIGR